MEVGGIFGVIKLSVGFLLLWHIQVECDKQLGSYPCMEDFELMIARAWQAASISSLSLDA